LHILGAATINLKVRSKTTAPHLTARLCDVHPDGQSTRITYGVLNLAQHKSREIPQALQADTAYDIAIKLNDCSYKIPKGHKLRLSLSTAYWPLIWSTCEKSELTLELEDCHLEIPKRQDTTAFATNFPEVESAPLADIEMLRESSNKRTVNKDLATGESTFEIYDDFGIQHIKRYNLNSEEVCHERYTIHPDNPTSAKAEISWKEGLSRGDWNIETETQTRMTADKDFFHIEATCIAKENGDVVFRKNWIEKVERKLL